MLTQEFTLRHSACYWGADVQHIRTGNGLRYLHHDQARSHNIVNAAINKQKNHLRERCASREHRNTPLARICATSTRACGTRRRIRNLATTHRSGPFQQGLPPLNCMDNPPNIPKPGSLPVDIATTCTSERFTSRSLWDTDSLVMFAYEPRSV